MAWMIDTNDPAYQWHAANGNDQERYRQMIAANKQQIEALKAELKELGGDSYSPMDDMDELDLQLASNRARAYDINNANAAIGRIDSRMTNRAKDALDRKKQATLDAESKALKIAEVEKTLSELQQKRADAKLPGEKKIIDAQIQFESTKLKQLGGTPFEFNWAGQLDANEVMMDYFRNTVNTKNGRKFIDSVTAEDRERIKNNLIDIGETEKAAEIEAMATPAEKKEAERKVKATKKALDTKIPVVEKVISTLGAKGAGRSRDEEILYQRALVEQDSIARNYPNYVELSGGHLKKKYKD